MAELRIVVVMAVSMLLDDSWLCGNTRGNRCLVYFEP
jgi:hypothetical protein